MRCGFLACITINAKFTPQFPFRFYVYVCALAQLAIQYPKSMFLASASLQKFSTGPVTKSMRAR